MENNVAIRFEHVNKSYGNREILKDFNLEIRKGEFLTIIGSSGSGKTTVLKLINGLISPTFGIIYVDGKDISKENQTLLRRNIGYVIQGIGLFPHMTIRKNIAYVPSLLNHRNKERTRKAVERLIDVVGLDRDMLDRYPAERPVVNANELVSPEPLPQTRISYSWTNRSGRLMRLHAKCYRVKLFVFTSS